MGLAPGSCGQAQPDLDVLTFSSQSLGKKGKYISVCMYICIYTYCLYICIHNCIHKTVEVYKSMLYIWKYMCYVLQEYIGECRYLYRRINTEIEKSLLLECIGGHRNTFLYYAILNI